MDTVVVVYYAFINYKMCCKSRQDQLRLRFRPWQFKEKIERDFSFLEYKIERDFDQNHWKQK